MQQSAASQQEAVRPGLPGLLLLVGLVVISALAVSYSVYNTRRLTTEVQQLKAEQNHLNTEWGQLQLENSTWGAYARVEKLARDKLDMVLPGPAQRVVVSP